MVLASVFNPDDMAILYAIETSNDRKGTLIDAYGFMQITNWGSL
jgi:hypothetical protein